MALTVSTSSKPRGCFQGEHMGSKRTQFGKRTSRWLEEPWKLGYAAESTAHTIQYRNWTSPPIILFIVVELQYAYEIDACNIAGTPVSFLHRCFLCRSTFPPPTGSTNIGTCVENRTARSLTKHVKNGERAITRFESPHHKQRKRDTVTRNHTCVFSEPTMPTTDCNQLSKQGKTHPQLTATLPTARLR